MARDDTPVLVIVLVAAISIVGIALAASSFATQRDFHHMMGGGGMMDDENVTASASTPGGFEWAVLIVSAILLVISAALLLRGRAAQRVSPAAGPPIWSTPPAPVVDRPAPAGSAPVQAVPEPTLVKLLDEDERRMYLEIRDRGGQVLQRDLVALGTFSKAKVTRVLDKLETKGLVVRERHGMTNRVRLVRGAAK